MNAANRNLARSVLAGLSVRFPWPRLGTGRGLIAGGAMIAVAVIGSYVAWRKYGGLVTNRSELLLTAENIEVTPQPPWIRTDVKAGVVRDGSLSNLSILDARVTVQVARAFALHPWVAEVVRVSKHHPARVVVKLKYRRPVAAVEVQKPEGGWGLFAVDAEGIVLPGEDFLQDDHLSRDYLRVWVGQTYPAGLYGTSWGDRRVAGAVRIADAIGPAWRDLGLYRIAACGETSGGRAEDPSYELYTCRAWPRIIWGRAPGYEIAGEPDGQEKTARLAAYVEEHGLLDRDSDVLEIDLTNRSKLLVTRRSGAAPGPGSPESAPTP